MLNYNYDNIPQELKDLKQWVCYTDKAPLSPLYNGNASPTNPDHWGTFEQAVRAVDKYNYKGIGFVFTDTTPYCGIDIDHCINPDTGEINNDALDIVQTVDSYTELSPSGTGIHIIYKGENHPKEWGRKKKDALGEGVDLEMYQEQRYFRVTGNQYGNYSAVCESEKMAQLVYDTFFGKTEDKLVVTPTPSSPCKPVIPLSDCDDSQSLSDDKIVELASRSKNGDKFKKLYYDGNKSEYGDDDSRADSGLCSILAFYTKDSTQIDRIFRKSGLMREKWDRPTAGSTYGKITVENALSLVTASYDTDYKKTPPVAHLKKTDKALQPVEDELSEGDSEDFSDSLIDDIDVVTEEEEQELLKISETDPIANIIFETAERLLDEYAADDFLKKFRENAKKQKQLTLFDRKVSIAMRNIRKRNKEIEQREYFEKLNKDREEQRKNAPYFIWFKENRDGTETPRVNPALLKKYVWERHPNVLVRNPATDGTDVYFYEGGIYKYISPDLLKGYLKEPIEEYNEAIVTPQDLNKAAELFKSDKASVTSNDFNLNENIIIFNNGVLHLDTMEIKKHSEENLSTIKIDCNYVPPTTIPDTSMAWEQAKEEAPVFSQYLIDLSSGNRKVIKLLLEFMGVAISNVWGWRFKTSLFLVGESNTGKSQLLSLIQKLVGNNNCSQITLRGLEQPHGEVAVYGKRFCFDPDMGFASVDELEKFKVLTGGDTMQFNPKFKTPFYAKFLGLLAFGCNKLPQFGGDKGAAVYNRIIPVECTNIIPQEKQNKHILADMYKEREAIIRLLIPYLLQTIKNNYRFDVPDCCLALKEQYKIDNDPIRQFITECCQWRTGENKNPHKNDYTRRQMYQTYAYWYSENYSRYKSGGSERTFKDRMLEILGEADITGKDAMFETSKGRYYAYTLNETGVEYFNEMQSKNNPQRKRY